MKTKSGVSALVLVALFLAAPVQATTLYSYDFEGLPVGGLAGQDGWANSVSGWGDAQVATDAGVNGTKVAAQDYNWGLFTAGENRSITPLSFGGADTAIVQEVHLMANNTAAGGGAAAGLKWSGVNPWYMLFGSAFDATLGGKTYLRDANGAEHTGDALVSGDWYAFKLVMDFSQSGVAASLHYRDITAAETSFTADSLLSNVNLGLTASGGLYTADGIAFRVDGLGSVDNYSVSSIPEPSSCVLMTAGLISLLAYAWRQRK